MVSIAAQLRKHVLRRVVLDDTGDSGRKKETSISGGVLVAWWLRTHG